MLNKKNTEVRYLLDMTKLQPGDIILESGHSFFSNVIKIFTLSKYSHAMIYVGNSVIHALTDGVYSLNPQRLLLRNPKDLKVLRYKGVFNTYALEQIIIYARNRSGSLYGYSAAGSSPLLGKLKIDAITSKQFCSRLVAQSYDDVGIRLVGNPHYCTPKDLNKSKLLIEIPNCVKVATQNEVEFAKSHNPIKENQRKTFEWLNKTRKVFKAKGVIIQTISDVTENLHDHPDLDPIISKFMKESGYLDDFISDKEINVYRFELKSFILAADEFGSPNQMMQIELDSLPGLIARHVQSYINSLINISNSSLEYYRLTADLYKNILVICRERVTVLRSAAIHYRNNRIEVACDEILTKMDRVLA